MNTRQEIEILIELHKTTVAVMAAGEDATGCHLCTDSINHLCITAARVREECEDALHELDNDVTTTGGVDYCYDIVG